MAALLPLALTVAVLSGMALWAPHGLIAIQSAGAALASFCRSIADGCVEYSAAIRLALLISGAAVLAGAFLYAAMKAFVRHHSSNRLVGRLPVKKDGAITVIDDDETRAAFTHGLLRPRIYVSTGLIDCLDGDELRSVLSHELHHKENLHPLKFILYSFVKDAFFWAPAVGHLVDRLKVQKELEADEAAALRTGRPVSLASAIVKAASRPARATAGVSITGKGGDDSRIGARVRKLVTGEEPVRRGPGFARVAASVLSAGLISAALLLPLASSATQALECSTDHCSLHIDKLGKECKTHCAGGHYHHRHA